MFSPISEILDELRNGRIIVLTDDEDRENEGDLVMAAEFVTPEAISFMVREAAGYLCLSLTERDCDRLDLPPQASVNTSVRGTPFTVSIDGHPKHGLTTGVSAKERARTIRMAIDPDLEANDFVRPGHINPLRARDGGVLVRIGQTEGSIDLCRLAGLYPAAVIIEIMREDGEMARLPDLETFCKDHKLKMCSVRQLIEHRLSSEPFIQRLDPVEGTPIQTPLGTFNCTAFRSLVDPLPHLALTVGDVGTLAPDGSVIETNEPTLVRVHRRDLLGDIFDDLSTPLSAPTPGPGPDATMTSSGRMLRESMRMIQDAGRGAVVYLRPHGIGESLSQRLSRPFGTDTTDAPINSVPHATLEYGTGSQILRALGVRTMKLLTNSDAEYPQLDAFGLTIAERVPVIPR
ncbi:MAG: 3,4-dihydroxy-2-butanone-4-phosphate synthase [Planctomycetota bacterium]|nr:3,4-dihydroxy-2-butanone-4-phosphate synthase [Planctomycetota bacterium]